jgi:hypothetical protein
LTGIEDVRSTALGNNTNAADDRRPYPSRGVPLPQLTAQDNSAIRTSGASRRAPLAVRRIGQRGDVGMPRRRGQPLGCHVCRASLWIRPSRDVDEELLQKSVGSSRATYAGRRCTPDDNARRTTTHAGRPGPTIDPSVVTPCAQCLSARQGQTALTPFARRAADAPRQGADTSKPRPGRQAVTRVASGVGAPAVVSAEAGAARCPGIRGDHARATGGEGASATQSAMLFGLRHGSQRSVANPSTRNAVSSEGSADIGIQFPSRSLPHSPITQPWRSAELAGGVADLRPHRCTAPR